MEHDEVKTLLIQQGEAFDQFKKTYEDALAAERKEREDLELRLSRGGIATGNRIEAKAVETERKAVGAFIRSGDETELKAMSVGSDTDGGYTVVRQMADTIRTKVRDLSPIAMLARRETVGAADGWAEPYDLSDMAAEWAGEPAARPGLATPAFGLLTVPPQEIYTSQVVTQKLLDTSNYNLGMWIEGRIADKFARAEGAAFIAGNGIAKPRGLLNYDSVTDGDSTRVDGKVQYVASGADGAFAASNPGDKLVDLIHAMRAPYRANASFLMNKNTAGVVRKFKDGQGRFLWADGLAVGMPDRLLGYPVYLDEEMPDIGSDSLSIAFGDFAQGYVIAEQPGVKMLRDPFSSKPNVVFYAYRRVGGAVADTDAIKLMKFAAA